MTVLGAALLSSWPADLRLVLASRSPRRLELLKQLFPADRIDVVPPKSADEAGFEGLEDWPAIETRLLEIARAKLANVQEQLRHQAPAPRIVIAADTIVIVQRKDKGQFVLGQPPDDPSWRDVVRHWFRDFYAGKTHTVATGLCVAYSGAVVARIAKTRVTFRNDVEPWLDAYLQSEEPCGKAGGYAIQDAGSVFVTRIEGSLSNVVGLPLEDLLTLLNVNRSEDGILRGEREA